MVSNTGESEASHKLLLKVNNNIADTKDIMLAGGQKTTVTFTVVRYATGTYQVDINGVTGSFNVIEAPLAWWTWLVGGLVVAVIIGALVFSMRLRRGNY